MRFTRQQGRQALHAKTCPSCKTEDEQGGCFICAPETNRLQKIFHGEQHLYLLTSSFGGRERYESLIPQIKSLILWNSEGNWSLQRLLQLKPSAFEKQTHPTNLRSRHACGLGLDRQSREEARAGERQRCAGAPRAHPWFPLLLRNKTLSSESWGLCKKASSSLHKIKPPSFPGGCGESWRRPARLPWWAFLGTAGWGPSLGPGLCYHDVLLHAKITPYSSESQHSGRSKRWEALRKHLLNK